jgi:glycosyltransferase involved in cell wall biosynthesis
VLRENKILHLVSSTGLYGAENVILNLSIKMELSPYKPIIGMISLRDGLLPKIGEAANTIGLETILFKTKHRLDIMSIYKIFRYIISEKISVVHSHGYKPSLYALLPCLILRIPFVITCHLWYTKKNDFFQKLYVKLESYIMRLASKVVGVSEDICETLVKNGIKIDKVEVIHNGIDLSTYSKSDPESINQLFKNLDISNKDFVIGAAGRLDEQKNYELLIDAVYHLKQKGHDIKCIILGEGPLRDELEEKIEKLSLVNNIFLPGYRSDVINFLKAIDVFVISSLDEGLPMILLEAMANGKAIISTPVGAIKKVLTHNVDALLFEVGNFHDLSNYLLMLKNDTLKKKNLGVSAKEKFEKEYTSDRMTYKYLKIYSSLIDGK